MDSSSPAKPFPPLPPIKHPSLSPGDVSASKNEIEAPPTISSADIESQKKTPSLAPIKVQPFVQEPLAALNEGLSMLVSAEKEIEQDVGAAEKLNNVPGISLERILEIHSPEINADPIGKKTKITDSILQGIGTTFDKIQHPFNLTDKYVIKSAKWIVDLVDTPDAVIDNLSQASAIVGHIQMGLDILSSPFEGVEIIIRGCFLNNAQNELDALVQEKNPPAAKQKQIVALKWFIQDQKEKIQSLLIDLSLKAFSYIPPATEAAFTIFKTAAPGVLTPIFSTVGPIICVIKAGINLSEAHHKSSLLEKWIKNPQFQDKVHEIPIRKRHEGESFTSSGAKAILSPVDELLLKRQAVFFERRENKREAFNHLIDRIENKIEYIVNEEMKGQGPQDFESKLNEEVKKMLKEANIDIQAAERRWEEKLKHEGRPESSEPLFNLIKNEGFKSILLDLYAEHEETISISTRNGIKALSNAKPLQEKKFFTFALNKERIILALTILAAVASIVLQVLAWTSVITLPLVCQAVPGLGIVVAGIALFAIGLYLFYRYNPSIFKTHMQGVQVRLALAKIPLAFEKFRLNRKKMHQNEVTSKVSYIQAPLEEIRGLLHQRDALANSQAILPASLSPILEDLKSSVQKKVNDAKTLEKKLQILKDILEKEYERYLTNQKSIALQVEKLEKNVDSLQKRADALTERLRNAGAYDFAKNMGLESHASPSEMDLYKIIADGIIDGDWSFDPATQEILEKRMGIPIAELTDNIDDKEEIRKRSKRL